MSVACPVYFLPVTGARMFAMDAIVFIISSNYGLKITSRGTTFIELLEQVTWCCYPNPEDLLQASWRNDLNLGGVLYH